MNPLASFLHFILYVQISPERLTVRNPQTGEQISEVPELAIIQGPKLTIAAVGSQARSASAQPNVRIVNPFAHPRTLISDFTVAEQLLRAFIKQAVRSRLFAPAPRIVMHPLGDPAGGFTQVEARAFRELGLSAGARASIVWQGRPLTDQELLSGQFPASGKLLD